MEDMPSSTWAPTERTVVLALVAVLVVVGVACAVWLFLRIGNGPDRDERSTVISAGASNSPAVAIATALGQCRRLLHVLATQRWVECRRWERTGQLPFDESADLLVCVPLVSSVTMLMLMQPLGCFVSSLRLCARSHATRILHGCIFSMI